MSESPLTVEVAYATPAQQYLIAVTVPAGSRVEDAIVQSGILGKCPEISLEKNKLAVWYKNAKRDSELKDGDRVMILRPLIADPKEIRRRRAEQAKQAGRADLVTGGRPSKLRRRDPDSSPVQRDA